MDARREAAFFSFEFVSAIVAGPGYVPTCAKPRQLLELLKRSSCGPGYTYTHQEQVQCLQG